MGEHDAIIREALCHIARDLQKEHSPNATIRLPGYGLPLERIPDSKNCFPVLMTNEDLEWSGSALLIRELCMLKVAEEITNTPNWWKNFRSTQITENWKTEILALDWKKYKKDADFTPPLWLNTVSKSSSSKPTFMKRRIPILASSACVIKSDKLTSNGLKGSLAKLESRPRSIRGHGALCDGGYIIRQVYTSLCPLVYGQSRTLPNKTINLENCLEACGEGDILPRPRSPGPHVRYRFYI
ncbi:hypothetical protein GGI43DRAFT_210982 [Trichoderma evansii]